MKYLLLLASLPAFALEGIVLGTSQSVNFTPPGTGVWSSITSWQYETRIRGFTAAGGSPKVFFGGDDENLYLGAGGTVLHARTNIGTSQFVSRDITGRSDVRVRLRRDCSAAPAAGTFTMETWNGDGTGYTFDSNVIGDCTAYVMNGATAIGSYDGSQLYCTPCDIDFGRMGTTLSPVASTAPQDAIASPTNLFDFEFEGNLTNASGTVTGVMSTGTATYDTSPTYPPVMSMGGTRTVRAGNTYAATAAASFSANGNGSFASYFWTCVSGPDTCRFSSRTTETTNIIFPTTGPYTVRLTGVDSTGETSYTDTVIGAAASDTNYQVISNISSGAELVKGPSLLQGQSPWDWFDDTYLDVSAAACAAIPALPGTTLRAGTVSVSDGSPTVTGSGTNFTTLGLSTGDVINIYYAAGHQRNKEITVSGITATSLTMTSNWDAGVGTVTGASFGTSTHDESIPWTSPSTGWNYYDAALGLYQQYYRTGKTEYKTCGASLADKFWTYTLDSGNICNTGTDCQPNRNQALLGMMMRANDGQSGMWTGILNLATIDYNGWLVPQYGDGLNWQIDPREAGYAFWFQVAIAALHPDAPTRATYLARAEAAFTQVWQQKQSAAGAWLIDADEPVTGLPSLGYSGLGTFPWHAFPILSGLQRLYALNSDPDILTVHALATSYISDYGWNPATSCYETRYATQFTTFDGGSMGAACPYSGGTIQCAQNANCVPVGRDMTGRALNQEGVSAFGWLYAQTGTAAYKTRGDLMFGKTFGDSGTGTDTDGGTGTFDDFLVSPEFYFLKEYGQVAGAGRAEEYLVYRNGPLSVPTNTTISYQFSLSGVATAAKIRLTVKQPSGATVTATCTTSPCSIAGVDTRQGSGALMQVEYLNSSDVVKAVGSWQPVTVP